VAPAVVAHPEARTTKGDFVTTGSVARGRKARTNRGKFSSLERRYWNGALSEAEEESFERIVYLMGRLYKDVRAA
jgi:hypothetical protein